jgi:pyruvate dehydrogenase E2 component (dihydrolipoamide acetyltransferase)
MAIDLVMPKLGLTMTEGSIQEWVATPGKPFAAGSVLLVVETEKIANEIEAVADGVLDRILVQAGDTVACGTAIATWTPKDPSAISAAAKSPDAAAQAVESAPPVSVSGSEGRARVEGVRVVSTPFARRLARELGVDLTKVEGSGPHGRIKGPDVAAFAAQGRGLSAHVEPVPVLAPSAVSAPATTTRRPATAFEKTAAERLTAAKQVPHFYLSTEIEVSALEKLRAQLNGLVGRPKVSVTHLLLSALARTLSDEPVANQVWDRGDVVSSASVDIGIAVNTERGLLAPVLRDLARARIHDIADQTRDLVERARTNKLKPHDFGGGATSISNAGMHDVTHMTSIITPGHSSIFGIGSVREVFRPDAKGQPALRREMGVVMSADHRILDGVSGLRVLNRFKLYLENPLQIVV